ncbi:MAG: hypothetical protein B5M56_05320, partial [Desulfococcus sp. 4484_241]
YGSRRILRQLLSEGYTIGRYRVRSLMRKLNLKARGRSVTRLSGSILTPGKWLSFKRPLTAIATGLPEIRF